MCCPYNLEKFKGGQQAGESFALFALRRKMQRHLHGEKILEPLDPTGKMLLADKGCDSDKFVGWVKERGEIAVIPSHITAKRPREIDQI